MKGIVEYVSDRSGEPVFEVHGERFQFVNAKYPDGKKDVGVYRFSEDMVYDLNYWRENFLRNKMANGGVVRPRRDMDESDVQNVIEDTMVMDENIAVSVAESSFERGGVIDLENYKDYRVFKLNKNARKIPVDELYIPKIDRDRVERAKIHIMDAIAKKIERRDPIHVVKIKGEDRWRVVDGTSTAQALKELGVKEIYSIKKMKHYPMRVTQKAKAIRKEGENWLDAIQRAKKRKRV
jgi:hypothetical protein